MQICRIDKLKPASYNATLLTMDYKISMKIYLFFLRFIFSILPLLGQENILHLHLVILQMLLSKATYKWGIHEAIHLEEANKQRKCS